MHMLNRSFLACVFASLCPLLIAREAPVVARLRPYLGYGSTALRRLAISPRATLASPRVRPHSFTPLFLSRAIPWISATGARHCSPLKVYYDENRRSYCRPQSGSAGRHTRPAPHAPFLRPKPATVTWAIPVDSEPPLFPQDEDEDEAARLDLSRGNSEKRVQTVRPTFLHRAISSCFYTVPLLDALQVYFPLLRARIPMVEAEAVTNTVETVLAFYKSIPMLNYLVFSGGYFVFVRRNIFNLPYFVKFHYMQTLLLTAFQHSMCSGMFRLFPSLGLDYTFKNDAALAAGTCLSLTSIGRSILTAILGRYPSIPVLSDSVRLHLGRKPSREA
eukprot:GHVU01027501.1.p1 GENE.GHVU01027501.1~~GHVU01027501.1.p1  ORF type:complete len:332 (-),score=10.14 GHVU01027501.1:286-1281(-)